MRIINSCILELREYEGQRIICQLKLDCSTGGEVNNKEPQGFHWLEKHHWQNFDEHLEKLVVNLSDKARSRNKIVDKNFKLHDEVEVRVTNSSTSLKTLMDCLGHVTLEKKGSTLALDFLFRRRVKIKYSKSKREDLGKEVISGISEELEYHPAPVSTILISPDSSCLSYVPSKIGCINYGIDNGTEPNIFGIDDEDRYSPKFPSEYTLPVYTPKPISKEKDIFANSSEEEDINSANKFGKSTVSKVCTDNDSSPKDVKIVKTRTSNEQHEISPNALSIQSQEEKDENAHLNSKKNTRTRHQYNRHVNNAHARKDEPATQRRLDAEEDESQNDWLCIKKDEDTKESHDDNIDLEKYVKQRNDKTSKSSARKDQQTLKTQSPDLKIDSTTHNQSNDLRRSNRTLAKTSPFKVESRAIKPTHTTQKIPKIVSNKMRECFGSGSESDDFAEKTPIKAVPKIQFGLEQMSSSVKKRKRDEKNERDCQQEKQSMSKWLSKKKPEDLVKSPKKASRNASTKTREKETKTSETKRTSSVIKRIVYPTPEEIADNERREKEQMKVNRKMKVLLEDLIQVPKKVDILSLNTMTADEILNTFPKYKNHLDDIFNKLRSKRNVTGYNGINHYSVIELIDNEKQLKIMNKLGEVYENESEGTSTYSTLFANALMPEWLVNVFKDKYEFTHSEAVIRLHDQQQYIQYMDAEDHH